MSMSSILNGFDNEGRPIIYMRPGRENTQKSPRQIDHLIFHLSVVRVFLRCGRNLLDVLFFVRNRERAIDFAPPGVETVTIVVDYKSATSQSNPSIGTARQVLHILQNHYVRSSVSVCVFKCGTDLQQLFPPG